MLLAITDGTSIRANTLSIIIHPLGGSLGLGIKIFAMDIHASLKY